MRMPKLLRISESLANRIILQVVLYVVVILTITALAGYHYAVKSIKLEGSVKANGILNIVEQRIDASLVSVEIAVRNHLQDIKENLHNPDELYSITHRMLEDNPAIVGSAIAFKPNYFPEQGVWFSPYSYRENDTIKTKQLGSAEYDYRTMDWYQTTELFQHDYWSEPYYDSGGGEMLMTTYSYPVTDEEGNFIAVVTADILLYNLSEYLKVDFFEQVYACIITRTGAFISNYGQELVLEQSIYGAAEEEGQTELIEVIQDMLEGKSGMREWKSPDIGDSYIFFIPFQRTGWSLAIVCQSAELFKEFLKMALILSILFILMLVLLTYILQKSVHRLISPLTRFTQAVDEVAKGNLQATLPVIHTKDEMQKLRHSFSTMQQSLKQQMEELKQVNEAKGRIEGELKVACDIQLSMLPKAFVPTSDSKNLDIYGQLIPAKEVGGDLYDFFIRSEKLFFCIGDVSGKGVPAALVMSSTLSLFRNIANYEDDLAKIVRSINMATCDGNDTMMFVTFFAGVLDLHSGRLLYCNAGHNKPLIVSDSIIELPAKPGLPLGISEDESYEVEECTLPVGDTLFLYTDGLTEAMNGQRKQFGKERLEKKLRRADNCKELAEEITQAVQQFAGKAPQSDDLTMLAICRCISSENI